MGNVVHLWNPRIDHRLGRHWIRFEDPIVVGGASPEQSGVLTVHPLEGDRLRARLKVIGSEFQEDIAPGNDIAIWINGLYMLVGVTAVEDGRALVAFGIPRGATGNVTLDVGNGTADRLDPAALPSFRTSAGLCQMHN